MVKRLGLFGFVLLLTACSANKNIRSSLEQDMTLMKQYASEGNSIEEIAKLKPQIAPPIKVAVTQPFGARYGHRSWTSEEIKEIESWLPDLKATGFVSELIFIPESIYPSCVPSVQSGCGISGVRLAAAKLHADAVLVINRAITTDAYVNPLSFLNLTVVGMWLVPAHHRDSYALYDTYLADVANGYIYGAARGEGEFKSIRPYMYSNTGTGQSEASIDALKALGLKMTAMARQAMQNKK